MHSTGAVPFMVKFTDLTTMGFTEDDVVESILTTISKDGQPNVAPMGVWVKASSQLFLRPYHETQTCQNLEYCREAVMNFTSDPRVFFATAFKETPVSSVQINFEPSNRVKPPRIKGMSGYVEVAVKARADKSDTPYKEFLCQVQHVEVHSPFPIVHSRARCAAIECIIHATRIQALNKTDVDTRRQLVHKIKELQKLVERIAPQSSSAKVIRDIMALVSNWSM
jgi:hypothetical protein